MPANQVSEDQVNEILKFLKKLGFKDVEGGTDFKIGTQYVHACCGHESTLLIIRCTTHKDINERITNFRSNMGGIIYGCKKHDKYGNYKRHIPILTVKYQKVIDTHYKHGLNSKERNVYIWDKKLIKYYLDLIKSIGSYAKYSLLAELGIKPDSSEKITFPAFMTYVGKRRQSKLFLFFLEAKNLMRFSYVARRELGFESFYQRMVIKERLTTIAKNYIEEKKKIFPNSIVVALEDNCWKFKKTITATKDLPDWQVYGNLTLYNNYRSCWIIDGQHRLFSYAHTKKPGILVVSAFAKINQEIQSEYFLDINREAKPVKPELLWDLTGSLNPNSQKGLISNAIKDLYDFTGGFFENNIKIPSKGNGKYSFNNLCVRLDKTELGEEKLGYLYKKVRNPFWNKDYKKFHRKLALGLNQYFTCFNEGLNNETQEELFSDGFITLMIELFKILIVQLRKRPTQEEEVKFFKSIWKYFNSLKKKDIQEIRKSLTSESRVKDFRNDMIKYIQENYDESYGKGLIEKEPSLADEINNLEFSLNKYVNSILEKEFGPDWIEDKSCFPDVAERKKCLANAKKYERPTWEFLNFSTTIHSIILMNNLWNNIFKTKFVSKDFFSNNDQFRMLSNMLWEYRSNKIGHKRGEPVLYTKAHENIIRSIYEIFTSIIESEQED